MLHSLRLFLYLHKNAKKLITIKEFFCLFISVPQGFNFFDMYMDTKARKLKVWAEIIPEFIYDSDKPFFETLVPTIDTVRYGYLFEKLLGSGKPVMFTGSTGMI